MRIKYLGHAAFTLTLEDGRTVVFDPYESGAYDGALAYGPITGKFDVAVVSHDHADHCCEGVISKAEHVIDSAGDQDVGGINRSDTGSPSAYRAAMARAASRTMAASSGGLMTVALSW